MVIFPAMLDPPLLRSGCFLPGFLGPGVKREGYRLWIAWSLAIRACASASVIRSPFSYSSQVIIYCLPSACPSDDASRSPPSPNRTGVARTCSLIPLRSRGNLQAIKAGKLPHPPSRGVSAVALPWRNHTGEACGVVGQFEIPVASEKPPPRSRALSVSNRSAIGSSSTLLDLWQAPH